MAMVYILYFDISVNLSLTSITPSDLNGRKKPKMGSWLELASRWPNLFLFLLPLLILLIRCT